MTRKLIWLFLSCLIVIALVLTSCGPAAEKKEGKTVVGKVVEKEAPEEKEEEVVKPEVKEPQYGGTLTVIAISTGAKPLAWDPREFAWATEYFSNAFWEQPLVGDLSRGPRGTNEFRFQGGYVPDDLLTGELAESWELKTDPLSLVFHIRKGVYFHNKPPVNGREMTAEDVAFALERFRTSPKLSKERFEWIDSIEATDKWTVVISMNRFDAEWPYLICYGVGSKIYPKEQVDIGWDWKDLIGTGPFMLVDYVGSASLTYKKNPNYWAKETIDGKEYRIPFIDTLSLPLIPDESTRLAALRTGKADILEACSWKFRESLERTNPELVRYRALAETTIIMSMRVDTSPFDDIKVRRALQLAIDKQAIIDSLYGGEAVLLSYPISKEFPESMVTPLDKLPESSKELFEYKPEEARRLLAEAGYPDGFKCEVVTIEAYTDLLDLVSAYWADIGVELEPKLYDVATWFSKAATKTHKDMFMWGLGTGHAIGALRNLMRPGDFYNLSIWNDPYWNETYAKMKSETDDNARYALVKNLYEYTIEMCGSIVLPTPYGYLYHWPWVKNYYGEINAGWLGKGSPIYARLWLDLEMKKEMGY